jgi:hypothetical protein
MMPRSVSSLSCLEFLPRLSSSCTAFIELYFKYNQILRNITFTILSTKSREHLLFNLIHVCIQLPLFHGDNEKRKFISEEDSSLLVMFVLRHLVGFLMLHGPFYFNVVQAGTYSRTEFLFRAVDKK